MRISGEPGFVLHARAWRETSLLVEVLSANHGRVGLVARGVQGPRRHPLRAALQPLQSIRFDAVQRGDLAQLRGAEAMDAAPRLVGDAMASAFYLNELTLRLAPRGDALPELFLAYASTRERLRQGEPLAWTLRRYERDLLDALGTGFDWSREAGGAGVDPAARYRVDPEAGPLRMVSDRGASDRQQGATGRGLLALASDETPEPGDLAGLRHALRTVLSHHLGPRGLKTWEMLARLPGREPVDPGRG